MMNPTMGFGLGWLWMALGTLIVVGLVIWLCASILGNRSQTTSTDTADRAMDILKRRYAHGEISKEQFDEMRRSLEA